MQHDMRAGPSPTPAGPPGRGRPGLRPRAADRCFSAAPARWEVETCGRLAAARCDRLAAGGVDAVLLDLGLPDAAGVEAVPDLCSASRRVPVLVLIGPEDDALGLAAVQAGAQDYLVKGPVETSAASRGRCATPSSASAPRTACASWRRPSTPCSSA